MFIYEKRLQYPVNIKTTSATLANAIVTQLGGLYTISDKLKLPYTTLN